MCCLYAAFIQSDILLAFINRSWSHSIRIRGGVMPAFHTSPYIASGPIAHTRCLISQKGKNYTQDVTQATL